MLILKKTLLLLILISLWGCSSKSVQTPSDFNLNSSRLYYARASYNSTDFEQFYLDGRNLFTECGKILRGKHKSQQQNYLDLPESDLKELNQLAFEVYQSKDTSVDLLAKPGKNKHLFDPGQYRLELNTTRGEKKYETSLDEVSSSGAGTARKLLAFTKKFRALSEGHLCGSDVFYGITQ